MDFVSIVALLAVLALFGSLLYLTAALILEGVNWLRAPRNPLPQSYPLVTVDLHDLREQEEKYSQSA